MLWRTSSGRALRALDSNGEERTRLGREILRALGISCRILRTLTARDSNFHRAAGGSGTHAPWTLSSVHVPGIVALVFRISLSRDEAGRKLARTGEVLSQVRRSDRSCVD